jgi:signal transduction histidine kinase
MRLAILLSNAQVNKLLGASFESDYWSSNWFRGICLCLGLIAILYLVLAKVRLDQAEVQRRILEASEEREDRFYDTSDMLVQGLQAIVWSIENATIHVEGIDRVEGILAHSLKQSKALVSEGRRNMKSLSRPSLGKDLPKAIAVAGRALQHGCQPKYTVIVHGEMRQLQPLLRDEVYRMGLQALSNAFRHAGANEIEAEFVYKRTEMRVYVRDDGHGISSLALLDRKHGVPHGIQLMHREAKRSGAAIEIRSRQNAGTEIELRVPSSLAYKEV